MERAEALTGLAVRPNDRGRLREGAALREKQTRE